MRSSRLHVALAVAATGVALAGAARADEAAADDGPARVPDILAAPPARTWHFVGGLALGDGLRFNNPYRLDRQIGDTAESMSLTSSYLDVGIGAAYGRPYGLAHGVALRLSTALTGVGQEALAPTYFGAYRGSHGAMAFGRVGPAILLRPDPNVGGEVSVGGAYFLTGGIGASAELVFDLFYGAGTAEVTYATYPILSGQLGIFIDYEVLP